MQHFNIIEKSICDWKWTATVRVQFFYRLSICKHASKFKFTASKAWVNSYILLWKNEEKPGDGQCAKTFRCVHRQAEKKGREEERGREREPPSVPQPSLLSHWWSCRWAEIGVAWPQLYRGQLSARLCWNYRLAFCPRRTDLAMTLNTASPRGWQILSPHFPNFAQKKPPNSAQKPTANPAPPVASPNLISHFRHNGKIRPLWTGIF